MNISSISYVGRSAYENIPRVLGKGSEATPLQMTNYIADVAIFECKQIPGGLHIHDRWCINST